MNICFTLLFVFIIVLVSVFVAGWTPVFLLIEGLKWGNLQWLSAVNAAIVVALITLFGLLINGMFLEPRRNREEREFQRQKQETEKEDRKKELHNALYSEMAHTYSRFMSTLKSMASSEDQNISSLFIASWPTTRYLDLMIELQNRFLESGFDVYKFTRKNPVLFYQLQDASALDDMYRSLLTTVNEILRELRNLTETKFSNEEEGIKAAEQVEDRLGRQYSWLEGRLTDHLLEKSIDITLLMQVLTEEWIKKFLRGLIEGWTQIEGHKEWGWYKITDIAPLEDDHANEDV